MNIRKTKIEDLNAVCEIYALARDFMRKNGNPNQWKNSYAERDVIINDIENGNSFVIEENAEIVGVFTFIIGQEPTYQIIKGQWLNDRPYGTIHRIASNGKAKSILNYCLSYCKSQTDNIRIDTHNYNFIMQHLLEKSGFIKCGIIYLQDCSPRIAYQKDFSEW